ncbi:glycosyltransferase family 52 protein [Vibrio sp. Vb2133]|uniref:glycosyltransferase family 52 protein n=1 Tax=Vibrio TaxID=662 RepID=UPI001EFD26FA|nr:MULTISPECIES: glycosyltransferase family 52 protein [Vibrio]MCG9612073.1 glycosyltransferase family 52 protein [Vibrio harveyi]MCG9670183.1 glycosyltransferase family 52 protein [Vibrio harveyi]MDW1748528.1 glycosyltransferase family 52 protein [Vibrio sp. Vb2133]MDW1791492.1 glycosyltransferase family 52 protein [Vibrio sp. Vb2132]MDW3147836.1 glycosyltransferase family 52 protein [Vibrio sp. 2132-1]
MENYLILNSAFKVSIFSKVLLRYGCIHGKYKEISNFFNYHENVFFGHDHLELFPLFKRIEDVRLLEDGLANYLDRPGNFQNEIKKIVGLDYKPFGYSDVVNKVYLINDKPSPKVIDNKATRVNGTDLYDYLARECKIFSTKPKLISDKSVVVLTQPLSEDGVLSEGEKKRIYQSICEYFINYTSYKVCLKLHPRDSTMYDIDNVEILESGVISELYYNDPNVEVVVSLFSSGAIDNSNSFGCQFLTIGCMFDKRLIHRFGKIKSDSSSYSIEINCILRGEN